MFPGRGSIASNSVVVNDYEMKKVPRKFLCASVALGPHCPLAADVDPLYRPTPLTCELTAARQVHVGNSHILEHLNVPYICVGRREGC